MWRCVPCEWAKHPVPENPSDMYEEFPKSEHPTASTYIEALTSDHKNPSNQLATTGTAESAYQASPEQILHSLIQPFRSKKNLLLITLFFFFFKKKIELLLQQRNFLTYFFDFYKNFGYTVFRIKARLIWGWRYQNLKRNIYHKLNRK